MNCWLGFFLLFKGALDARRKLSLKVYGNITELLKVQRCCDGKQGSLNMEHQTDLQTKTLYNDQYRQYNGGHNTTLYSGHLRP